MYSMSCLKQSKSTIPFFFVEMQNLKQNGNTNLLNKFGFPLHLESIDVFQRITNFTQGMLAVHHALQEFRF